MLSYLKRRPPFDAEASREQLRRRLDRLEGLQLRGGVDGRPRMSFEALARGDTAQRLIETLDWLIEQLRLAADE